VNCEICLVEKETPAIVLATRVWENAEEDHNMPLCAEHSKDDPDGMFKFINVRPVC